jgi:tetratricopeptide (TPR) repeat protein
LQPLSVLAISLALLPLAGPVPPKRQPGPAELAPETEPAESRAERTQGNALFRAGRYAAAIRVYQRGAAGARGRGDARSELRFLNNLGSASYQSYRYRDAAGSYLRARELALAQRDTETLGAICFNLSSLYERMSDTAAAMEAARQGMALPAAATGKFRAQLLLQMAKLQPAGPGPATSIALQREAIAVAQNRLDVIAEAQAWSELGATLLDAGQLDEAEFALLQAYRLRRLRNEAHLYYSYELLGRLMAQRGNQVLAEVLFGRAIEAARQSGPPAMWSGYYWRGRAMLAQGRPEAAYRDLAMALRYLARWRAEVLPADSFRVSSEADSQKIYSAFVEVAARLYRETGKIEYAGEALAAAETNRAASLRALWAGGGLSRRLPPEYGETLAGLRQTEAALLQEDSPVVAGRAAALRLRLAEMEASAGMASPAGAEAEPLDGRKLLRHVRGYLRPGDLLLAFHCGERESLVWALTRERFQLASIPGRESLAPAVQRFASEIRAGQATARATGAALFRSLFGGLDAALLARPVWIVAPDGPLFELPFAALPEGPAGGYLVERHAVREVPGIAATARAPGVAPEGPFVGFGDPIYNRADPRRRGGTPATAANRPGEIMELARLPGSGREVDACALAWRERGRETVILKGPDANRRNLLAAIERHPAVLHLAVHILFPAHTAGPGMLALSQEAGGVELLSAAEIASLRSELGLVVLDGCSSGSGPILPGAGLMGLTRAWLAAGARSVLVTRWPAADQDAGEMFRAFYASALQPGAGGQTPASEILRRAQLERLRLGGPQASPAKWASYFCVERS